MRPQEPRRLLVLHTHPVQYCAPIFRTLSSRRVISVQVLYLSDAGVASHFDPGFGREIQWDVDLLDGYQHRVLRPNFPIATGTFWSRHDSALAAALTESRPDWILLYGYASRMNWVALRWAKRHGVRVAYYSDSNVRLVGKRSRQFLPKKLLLQWYFSQLDAFLSPGDANRGYLRLFGADERRIHWCPFAIDVERFKAARASAVEPPVDFVWAGKLIALKRPIDFVEALAGLVDQGHNTVTARIIGSGPLLNQLQNYAARILPAGAVTFSGFVNQAAMPAELCRGSIFVFTSESDQYGLSVTEAAACGRALIVADVNGCVGPSASARQHVNALTYRAGGVQALTDCMRQLLVDPARVERMQSASAEIAAEHDIERAADVIEHLVMDGSLSHAA